MPRKAGRPTKPKLTREQIIAETIELMRESKTEPGMRALATHLGVDPMAIYHYFPDRDALWCAALEEVFSALPPAPVGESWHENALALLISYHAIALKNFRLTHFLVTHGALQIAPIEAFNRELLQTLGGAGFTPERTELMRDLLIDYLHGYLMAEVHFSAKEKKQRAHQISVTLRWLLTSLQ